MTEAEYVEHIRKTAEAYVAVLRNPAFERLRDPTDEWPIRNWQQVKEKLSPHTAIAMAEAWLAQEAREASKSSEGGDVAPE